MRKLLIISFILNALIADATHIVGGEFQIRYIRGFNYDLSLNLYFDVNNGNPAAEDNSIGVSVYSKKDHKYIQSFTLNKKSENGLVYLYPNCAISSLKTKRIVYAPEEPIYLDPAIFNDAEGYYFSWERCCRNNVITNIIEPQNSGMTFYMEIPPVSLNSSRFVNSSPVLPTAFAEYGCIGQLFSYSFKSTDRDNDRLVYSLVNPLEGNSTASQPVPGPVSGPYDPVTWKTGYNLNYMVDGAPTLSINSQTGLMQVVPTKAGLYVFAVKIEEYRNNVKIGEVRREFQLKVINCPVNTKPEIQLMNVNSQGNTVVYNSATDTIVIKKEDENFCYKLKIADYDANENVTIKLLPLNFGEGYVEVDKTGGLIRNQNDTLVAEICWTKCIEDSLPYYKLAIIATDDGCTTPLSDTVVAVFKIEKRPNQKPKIEIENTYNLELTEANLITVAAGDEIAFNLVGYDPDSAKITIDGKGLNFNFKDNKVEFNPVTGSTLIKAPFRWKTSCEYKFDGIYRALFWIKDLNCLQSDSVRFEVQIKIKDKSDSVVVFLPPNVFTPNGDGINDFFEIESLPLDICDNSFEEIEIYNRWGMAVFKANTRKFSWNGGKVPDGVYFYTVKYTNNTYKGHISIIR